MSVDSFANIFSHSEGCLFVLLMVSFSVQGLSLVVANGATLHRGVRASHCRGLSCCGAQAPDEQAQ